MPKHISMLSVVNLLVYLTKCANFVFLFVGCVSFSNRLVCLWDGSAQTTVRAATLRENLLSKRSISPDHSILTPLLLLYVITTATTLMMMMT